MDKEEIKRLFDKYNSGQATEEERALLESWYVKNTDEKPLDLSAEEIEDDIQEVFGFLPKPRHIVAIWFRIAAAASIILCVSIGGYFLIHKNKPTQQTAQTHDIAPGGNRAILTLSNGRTIDLSAAKNGKLANQGSMVISKNANGQIVYADSEDNSPSQNNGFNIAATPRGGQYQLVLADGTKVWLNAASSIKYPVVFNGNERRVELTGEAYFEVAHNKEKPFRVISNGQQVEVLGTQFNINAYGDENAVKTTLLEGSVKVSSAGKDKILKPGEQAQLEGGNIRVAEVDVDEVMAWKNGFFYFKDANIQGVMKELARWYDVEVKYDGVLPSRAFSGEIPRNVNASQILDILTFKKIHYQIDGKTIIIKP
jgi:ferric-dicitrate binding protein FerR (iron transport regulator)